MLVANRLADVAISPSVPDDPALAVVTEPIFRYRLVVVTAGQSGLRGSPRQWRWLVDPSGTDPGTAAGQLLGRLAIPEDMIRVFPTRPPPEAAADGRARPQPSEHLIAQAAAPGRALPGGRARRCRWTPAGKSAMLDRQQRSAASARSGASWARRRRCT